MSILLKSIAIILLVDFITDIVHWLENSFWSPETPILGQWIVIPNLAHLTIINANQIHKWVQITRFDNKPKIIAFLQKIYLLERTQHHSQYHLKQNNTHYCAITNALNPLTRSNKVLACY